MSETSKPTRKTNPQDRVLVKPEAGIRIDSWLKNLTGKYPGIKIKRGDLVNWLISRHPEVLTDDEVREIGQNHYDQMQLAQWILRRVKEAQQAGKTVTVQDVMAAAPFPV